VGLLRRGPAAGLDVYEHAYARDFGATPSGRQTYVEAFFANLDWEHVERQVERAIACRDGGKLVGRRELYSGSTGGR
jgi:hypothetical protein